MIGYIGLGILLLGAVGYIIYIHTRRTPKKLSDNFKAAVKEVGNSFEEERKKLRDEQVKGIMEEVAHLQNELKLNKEFFNQQKQTWKDLLATAEQEYNEKKQSLEQSIQNQLQDSQKDLVERLSKRQQEIENEVHKLEDKYNLTVQDYESKMLDIQCKFEEEEKALTQRVEEKKNEINILIEQFKKDEEARKEADFYRIPISSAAKNDIDKLKGVAAQLNKPAVLHKLIWENYYKNGFDQMIGRVLGKDAEKSGIYKITNTKNQMCYIGQAANIKTRWRTHCRRGVKAEEGTSNRLYQIMWEEGLENFTFQVVEFCDKDRLTEREKFYIEFFQAKSYGYNSKT